MARPRRRRPSRCSSSRRCLYSHLHPHLHPHPHLGPHSRLILAPALAPTLAPTLTRNGLPSEQVAPPAENFEQALEGGKKLTQLIVEQLKGALGLAPRSALSMQQQINRQLATMRAAHAAELRRRPDDDGSGEANDFAAEAAAAEEAEQNRGDLALAQLELKTLRTQAAAQAEEIQQGKIKLATAQAKAKEQAQALQQAKARPTSGRPASGGGGGASRPPSAGHMSLAEQAHSQRAAEVYPPEKVAEVYQDMLQVSLEEKEQLKQHSQAEIEAAGEAAVAAAAAMHHQEVAAIREDYEHQISQLQAWRDLPSPPPAPSTGILSPHLRPPPRPHLHPAPCPDQAKLLRENDPEAAEAAAAAEREEKEAQQQRHEEALARVEELEEAQRLEHAERDELQATLVRVSRAAPLPSRSLPPHLSPLAPSPPPHRRAHTSLRRGATQSHGQHPPTAPRSP